jgi:hypothetical protein
VEDSVEVGVKRPSVQELTKILSPIVTRVRWGIVVESRILAFVILSVAVGDLVAVSVP